MSADLRLYDQAKRLRAKGDLAGAIALMEKLVARRPEAPLIQMLGHYRMDAGDRSAALEAFIHATEVDPGFARGLAMVGRLLVEAGDFEDAESYLRQALELEDDPVTLVNLAILLDRTDRHAETISVLERAMDLDPQNEEIPYLLGLVVDDGERALSLFRRAARLGYEPARRRLAGR